MSYRVVKIISTDRIVVNAGKYDVKEGEKMRIIIPNSEAVIDPETGVNLGNLDYVKAKLRVEVVYDNMCICRNDDSINAFNPFLGFDRPVSLNVDASQISGGYGTGSFSREIKIGDIVDKL